MRLSLFINKQVLVSSIDRQSVSMRIRRLIEKQTRGFKTLSFFQGDYYKPACTSFYNSQLEITKAQKLGTSRRLNWINEKMQRNCYQKLAIRIIQRLIYWTCAYKSHVSGERQIYIPKTDTLGDGRKFPEKGAISDLELLSFNDSSRR